MFRVTLVFQDPNQARKVARFDTDKQAQDSLAQELRKWAAVKMAFIDDFDSKQRHVYGPLGKFEWTVPLSTVGEHLL